MKIKFVIPDLSDVFGQDSEYLFAKELKQQSGMFEGDPDWVYAWYLSSAPGPLKKFTANAPKIPKDRKYKVFGRFGDTQHQPLYVIKRLNRMEIDLLFFAYYDSRYWQYLRAKPVWLPWSYDPTYFYPSDDEPIYDVAFLGSVSGAYPLRTAINKGLPILSEKYGWETLHRTWTDAPTPSRWYLLHNPLDILERVQRYLLYGWWYALPLFVKRLLAPQQVPQHDGGHSTPRPTLGQVSQLEKNSNYIVGQHYAEVLRSTKVFIFGTSIFKHPIKRLFFGLGSGTCVLMDTPNCADKLGLIDGENYVSISEDNWAEKLKWILGDEEERYRIARNGLRLAQERHTHRVRAGEVLRILQDESLYN